MKIGIDCRLWDESGVGRYIRNLVLNLQKIDKKNAYVLFALSKDSEEILRNASNGNFRITIANVRWHTIEEQLRFPQVISKENLDLMHFPYVSVPIFYNKAFIVTIHDLIPYHFSTGEASTLFLPLYKLKFLGYKFIISTAAKKAKKIIAVSNATRKEIIEHLKVSEDKVSVTYEGIDDKLNSKLKIQNSKLQLKIQKYFLCVGNAYPHKNLYRLLEAFNILIFQYPNVSLVFVGKEDYFYKRLKEKAGNMNLEKSIIFVGEVSDEELGNLYKNAQALILPSLMEGFGLPALEAMANGCLVLASDIPALEEICADAAIYFDPHNINDIVKKMKEAYSSDTNHYSGKIRMGIERAKMFSWEKMAMETLEIYEKSKMQTSGK